MNKNDDILISHRETVVNLAYQDLQESLDWLAYQDLWDQLDLPDHRDLQEVIIESDLWVSSLLF